MTIAAEKGKVNLSLIEASFRRVQVQVVGTEKAVKQ